MTNTPDKRHDYVSAADLKRVKRGSMLRKQRRTVVIFAAIILLLSVAWGFVNYWINIYVFTDSADGSKYYIKRADGVYAMYHKAGDMLEITPDGNFVTDSGTVVSVDKEKGTAKTVAVVDTDDGEDVGLLNNLMMFPYVERTDIKSLTVNNDYGTYTFYRNSNDLLVIKDHEGTAYDQELFASLITSCGYTVTAKKLDTAKVLEFGYDEYGLLPCTRVDADGNEYQYTPASYSLTTINGVTYNVIIGDMTPPGNGYYAKLEGRDAVYILAQTLNETVLQPIETLVTPMLVYPMTLSTYFDVDDFTIFKYDYENFDDDEIVDVYEGETIFSVSYIDLEDRENTIYQLYTYGMATEYLDGYIPSGDDIADVLQKFYLMDGMKTVKLGITDSKTGDFDSAILAEYGLDRPSYSVAFKYPATDEATGETVVIDNFFIIGDLTENGTYYAASVLFDMIVEVNKSEFEFTDYELAHWIDSRLYCINIAYCNELDISSPSFNVRFHIDNSKSDQSDGANSDEIVVKTDSGLICNDITTGSTPSSRIKDKEKSYKNFRAFYASLTTITIDGMADLTADEMEALKASDDSKCQLVMTIKVDDGKNDPQTYVYRFYKLSERKSYVTVNGQGEFYVLRSFVDKIISDAEKVITGVDIDTSAKK